MKNLKASDLGFGHMGNGITVWDRSRTNGSRDYLTVAHISHDRIVDYWEEVSDEQRAEIEKYAKTGDPQISQTQDQKVFSTPPQRPVLKGLLVYIYQNSLGNCSNDGISKTCHQAVLVGEGIDQIFEADPLTKPAIKVSKKKTFRGDAEYIFVEPVEKPEGKYGPMFGGCFVYTSDSRFTEISRYPLPLHDRFE